MWRARGREAVPPVDAFAGTRRGRPVRMRVKWSEAVTAFAVRPRAAAVELLRPANLVTAAADVLAGFAVAGLANPRVLPWLLLSTVALYGGGVVLNDVFDADVDSLERPERPIPSARISRGAASLLGTSLLSVGIASALVASPVSCLLAVSIAVSAVMYDSWGKHQPGIAALNMGLCRGLNMLLGVSAVSSVLAQRWWIAAIPVLFVAAITTVSAGEVRGGDRRSAALALALMALVVVALLSLFLVAPKSWAVLPFAAAFAWRVVPPFVRVYLLPDAERSRTAVRTGVLNLIVLDSAIAAAFGGLLFGAVVVVLLAVAALLARLFAVT